MGTPLSTVTDMTTMREGMRDLEADPELEFQPQNTFIFGHSGFVVGV